MSTITLTRLCERMMRDGYVWASFQNNVDKDPWEKISQGMDPKKKGTATMKASGVYFSELGVNSLTKECEPDWKIFVENEGGNEEMPTSEWLDYLSNNDLLFIKPKASARFITPFNGLTAYREGRTFIDKKKFRYNDIPATKWDGVEINPETSMDDTFDYWNIHTLVVWNKACLETCVAFKAVPDHTWTYFDNAINLNIRSTGSSDVEAQSDLTAAAQEQLLWFDTKTDKIVKFLEETNAKEWDDTYLEKLRHFDDDLVNVMARFIKKNWKESSYHIITLFKQFHEKRANIRGAVALGLYTFYEHVWREIRGANGFEPSHMRISPLALVRQVFLTDHQKPVPWRDKERDWMFETVADFGRNQLNGMTDTDRSNAQRDLKEEASYYRHAGKRYDSIVALLDALSKGVERAQMGNNMSLSTLHDVLAAMRVRIAKLEQDWSDQK